jgi:membrane protein DedA with SNARE-associated domain
VLERLERCIGRRGDLAVLVGSVTPVVRPLVSVPAGAARMPLGRFVLFTLVGSAIWAFALVGVGWGMGAGYRPFHTGFDLANAAVVGVVLVGVIAVALWARRRRPVDA